MAANRRRHRKKSERAVFWTAVVAISLVAAFCVLVTISEQLEKPFLPTWEEIYQKVGFAEPEPLSTELAVHVIDVGNADAILLRSGSANMLIDAGENSDGDVVVDYLRGQGVSKLDLVIATHADADHIGGMDTVIREIEVGEYVMSTMPEGYTPTTKTYTDVLEALLDRQVRVTEAKPGLTFALGEAQVDILGPVGEYTENNNQSVVCKVTFGARRFLFMGDAEKEAEDALLAAHTDLRADFVKLGHHGSHSSSQEKFLRQVAPEYAVITCGAGNSYGHPHSETLVTLNNLGISCYRCDEDGTIVVTTDGSTMDIRTQKAA